MYDSAAYSCDNVPQQPRPPAIVPQVLDDREVADHTPTDLARRRPVAGRHQRPDAVTQRRQPSAVNGADGFLADELAVEGCLVVDWARDVDTATL